MGNWGNLVDLGTSPFGTVPYALYAGTVFGIDKKLNIADSLTNYVTPAQLNAKTFDQTPILNSIGTKLNFTEDQVKPVLNLSLKKDNVESAISGTGKDDYAFGGRYLSDDKLTELGIGYSNTDQNKQAKLTVKKSFSTGGLLKQGKPKLALRGWK